MQLAGLPVDLAFAVAGAGVDLSLDDDDLEQALLDAIAQRRGYVEIALGADGWIVELLAPVRESFHHRTRTLALAWCLVWLLTESGELGIGAYRS